MLLKDKNAVIYGGGGSIGGAVARAFAREGANVFLAGRTRAKLEEVSDEIRSSGGVAETAQVDALDGRAVDGHADAVAASAGGIDISFNLISHGDVHRTPMAEMDLEDYARPVVTAVRTTFLTWRAAARHMIRQGSGVILAFGGSGDPIRLPDMETLEREAKAWCKERNRVGRSVDWRFRTEDARIKLRSLYPSTEV